MNLWWFFSASQLLLSAWLGFLGGISYTNWGLLKLRTFCSICTIHCKTRDRKTQLITSPSTFVCEGEADNIHPPLCRGLSQELSSESLLILVLRRWGALALLWHQRDPPQSLPGEGGNVHVNISAVGNNLFFFSLQGLMLPKAPGIGAASWMGLWGTQEYWGQWCLGF